jgi:thiol-disulfide isomerase/thioredoxin
VDGSFRRTGDGAHHGLVLARVILVLAVVAVSAGLGLWWRARQGVVRLTGTEGPGGNSWPERGVTLGAEATFVQFSTDFCSPCRATSRVLHTFAQARDGVVHTELDIDAHLALVRELSVLRAPTVVVLDRAGTEIARMSGAVSGAQAEQALGLAARAA